MGNATDDDEPPFSFHHKRSAGLIDLERKLLNVRTITEIEPVRKQPVTNTSSKQDDRNRREPQLSHLGSDDHLREIGRCISSSKCERSHSMEKRAEQVELLERRESCMNSPRCCFFVFRSCGCNISVILILSFVSFDGHESITIRRHQIAYSKLITSMNFFVGSVSTVLCQFLRTQRISPPQIRPTQQSELHN